MEQTKPENSADENRERNTHGDDVLGCGTVVTRAHVALERSLQVASLIMEISEVIMSHTNTLFNQVCLVPV